MRKPAARGIVPWAVVLTLAAGCASRPAGPVAPPAPSPPAYEPEGPEDFVGPQLEVPPAPEARTPATPRPRPTPTPPPEEPAPPDTLPAPTISVELTPEERARLGRETEDDLVHAREALARLGAAVLSAAEQETAGTLRDLIDAAVAARSRDDLRAAAQLARKARLLADELLKGR